MKKVFRALSVLSFICCSVVLMLISVGYSRIPNEISMKEYDTLTAGGTYMCQPINISANATLNSSDELETSVKLFNIFPIKSARVNMSDRKYVVLGGDIFGIRLYTKGVMIVKIDSVDTSQGKVSPGNKAGLKVGDIILKVDSEEIENNKQLSSLISSSQGKTLRMKVERGGKVLDISFNAAQSSDGSKYKAGLWIRDSTAGIGTMTYYDRQTGVFAGLGHAVCDVDTGEIMPLSGGDAVAATVKGCYKGKSGTPGELCGIFSGKSMGELFINGDTGIYGVLSEYNRNAQVIPVALPSEVSTGKVQIVSTVDENGPKYYSAEIVKISTDSADMHNMVIKITDKTLIELTGGIVQGMSGSPIIQNGKLVGAVTHVFVDNATQGYGIFAQNMVETQQSLEENLARKQAS